MATRRRYQGKSGSQSGSKNELEQYIIAINDSLVRRGLACVEKMPDPVQIEKVVKGKIIGRTVTNRLTDFMGSMPYAMMGQTKIARAVVGEAKIQSRTGSLGLDNDHFKNHQKTTLLTHANLGAVCWIWARRKPKQLKTKMVTEANFLIPVLPDTGTPGFDLLTAKSVKWDDLVKWKMPPGYTWYDACVVRGQPVWELYCEEGWGPVAALHDTRRW